MQVKTAAAHAVDLGLKSCNDLAAPQNFFSLCDLKKGERGEVVLISEKQLDSESALPAGELEKRLLEMGFVEGTEVTLEHEGMIGKDPIAVLIRVCSLVALRRKEAQAILVRKIS
ncbi:FeoA family protein [Fluviispira multicolorata]|uniref:Ferrous iron transport protein A n=1 Tax=Fluviispira multicolorata TaxID=2654512 RepID=A0A833JDT6_9BACT|nr:FeoA family protein [Fluviispira multicolorata]KAB8031949.1 ferrous iron transport protein A [Fluviispira multicolorata]